MNTQSTAFEYDEFEQFLLEAAKTDEAPANLPSQLGVALGLGVPMLIASEMTSLMPTTTAISGGGAATVAHSIAPTGLFGTLKAALGVGAATMMSTAVKGIAVGLISGTALVGTGQAISKLTGHYVSAPQSVAAQAVANVDNNSPMSERQPETPLAVAPPPPPPPPAERAAEAEGQVPVGNPRPVDLTGANAPPASGKRAPEFVRRISAGATFERGVLTNVPVAAETKPLKRLPRPIFPEKTTAIARYPLLYDDVSAYYDAPKKQSAQPAAAPKAVAAFDSDVLIDPAEVATLRTKTIQRCRLLLGQSKAGLALGEIDGFRKRVGDKNFGVDEYLIRIEALAILGRAKEAQAEVANVERLAPNSAALRQAQQLAASRFVR